MNSKHPFKLHEMKAKIDRLEALALELQQLGEGLPVIEKNCRSILSAAYVLKHGISDIADLDAGQGGE